MSGIVNYWAIAAGLVAAPFYLTLIILLGALEPEFSHLSMPMSILGGVPGARGLVFNTGVAITGLFIIAFGYALWWQLPTKLTAKVGVGLLVVGGLGMIGAGYFHCNEGCRNILTEPDLVGRVHIIMSLLAGMTTAVAPFFVWAAMRGSAKWQTLARPTLATAIFANLPGITFWVTFSTGFRLVSVEGLVQRLGFAIVLLWIFFVTLTLRQLARR